MTMIDQDPLAEPGVDAETTRRVPPIEDSEMHSAAVFTTYQRQTWEMSQIPWEDFRPDKVKPEYIVFAKGAIMGESNSVAATHGLLEEFRDDYDFSQFACIWGYQEIQHHLVFQTWLQMAGHAVSFNKIAVMREPYPPGVTKAASLATNIICEVLTNHMYKCVSRAVEEPVIAAIMRRASGDEARHAREFAHYTKRRLASHPEETQSVLETLYLYMGTTREMYRHPVSRFKGHLKELEGHETIDEVFRFFAEVDEGGKEWERCCEQLFTYFTDVTGHQLSKMSHVRRAISELADAS
ncbi:ferritin-like domain-containing protein [Kibdelosporangium aridum]|uniref:ferritin-like domain-containing protein n=1 Tax=Kibdelosporangium aridum TaxID=2030 RepID=UPI000A57EF28